LIHANLTNYLTSLQPPAGGSACYVLDTESIIMTHAVDLSVTFLKKQFKPFVDNPKMQNHVLELFLPTALLRKSSAIM